MVSLVAALVLWFAADLQTTIRYHRALAESGGHVTHSDAIDRLAGWLDEREVKQPIALDWGIDAPVRYLTEQPGRTAGDLRLRPAGCTRSWVRTTRRTIPARSKPLLYCTDARKHGLRRSA